MQIKCCLFIVALFFFSFSVQADESRKADLLLFYHSIKNKQVELLQNQPLSITSTITDNRLSAAIYAVKKYDFKKLTEKLSDPYQWCQFVTLHLNIKACVFQLLPQKTLIFYAGRKYFEPAENAYELRYQFKQDYLNDEYFKLRLIAEDGPFGTKDYLINLEILKVNEEILLHFSLSYQTSFSSRLGTSIYLSTLGANKVGFSKQINDQGKESYIGGIEAIIERNVMRYFLALSVYMDYSGQEQMSEAWFLETEKYSKQLHEVEKADYLKSKQLEFDQQFKMQQRINAGKSVFIPDED